MSAAAATERGTSAREVMDRVTEAMMTRKDLDELKALYADDCVIETPDAGTLRGPDAVATWFGQFLTALPDASWESSSKHESGNVAIDEGFVVGTNTGPLALPTGEELAPTGKRVRVRGCDIATVEDGKVASHHFYFDQLELFTQLGIQRVGATSRQRRRSPSRAHRRVATPCASGRRRGRRA